MKDSVPKMDRDPLRQLFFLYRKGVSTISNDAIILAAGSGTRMKAGKNKLFLELSGKTVLEHTIEAFESSDSIDGIVLVAKKEEREWVEKLVSERSYHKIISTVNGGKERQDSVLCGLKALPESCERVLIHDGARPFVTDALLRALLDALKVDCGTVAGVPAKDTIKRVNADGMVVETLVRSELWQMQTPQCFYKEPILKCYLDADREGFRGTDDASLAEHYGMDVKIIRSHYENIKLTTPEDLDLAEVFLKRMER